MLYSPGRGGKKMREQTDKRGKMRHRLLKHLGIAALRGWRGDMEGGEEKAPF